MVWDGSNQSVEISSGDKTIK
ncbi:hypothetical protein [Paenibacillus mucilaginosus]